MVTCPKCNKELSDGTKFCDGCGARIFETVFCPNCGAQTSTEFAFCQSCGASIAEAPAPEQPVATPVLKKKLPKKAITFGGIGVAAVVVLILVISLVFGRGGKGKDNYSLYLKDREIFFTDVKKGDESWQLTSRLVDGSDISNHSLAGSSDYLGRLIRISDNGKYIFFPDKIDEDAEGFNLYYKETSKPDAEATKIDSDVYWYLINKAGTIVTYQKGDAGDLYQYKISDDSKEKIASEVEAYGFQVSDDGKKIGYFNSEGSIYLKYANKEKEKIASDVDSVEYVTEDFTTVYYIKDDTLYKQVEGKDKVKVASDVYDVLQISDSGEVYYLKKDTETTPLMNYVTDDMKETDATLTQPTYPTYPDRPSSPSWWHYDSDAEYEAAYAVYEQEYSEWQAERERLQNEYYAARDAYQAKQKRDTLRERLEKETLETSVYSLCFCDGKEDVVITDAFVGGYDSDYTCADKAAVISYTAYNQSVPEKVKLSEVESAYDVKKKVEMALFASTDRYIAVKGTTTIIEAEKEATHVKINSSGTLVYYFDNATGKNSCDLYRITISNGVVGKAEAYDSGVYVYRCDFVNDSDFKYFRDYSGTDDKGDLYVNKTLIDSDVYGNMVWGNDAFDTVVYFTDWNSSKKYGTLKMYENKKTVKIADDVHSFSVTANGQVLYLYDYSLNYCKGELYAWSNGKARKIDDDVICVLPLDFDEERVYSGW